MKKILFITFILLMGLVSAAPFTPQGEIDLVKLYGIQNATNISAEYYCNYTTCYEIDDFLTTGTAYSAGSNLTLTGQVFALNTTGVLEWLDNVYLKIVDAFSGAYADLTGKPTLLSNFTDDLGNRGYTHLTNYTDDLGDRGYTSLTNFTDDILWTTDFNSTGDGRWVNTDGDTMTGDLNMGNNDIWNVNTINVSNISYVYHLQSFDGNSIYIQPTGDEDDFFSFKTPLDRPTIKREGGKFIYFESSNVYDVGISFRKDDTYSGTLAYAKDDNIFKVLGKDSPVAIVPNSEYLNYLLFETFNHQPQISVFNGTILKINDSLEVIGDGNFTGALTAATLNTGQGDNELYDMDQNVQTTDSPTFDNLNLNNNLTIFGSIIQNGYRLINLTSNALISGDIFAIMTTGPSGVELPHLYMQPGGSGQFSGLVRSWGVVDERVEFLNNTNRTDCQAYFDVIGEELKIDCNTTTTGADFFVSDDFQVVGDVWIKDTEGDWHFMTRSLSVQDELNNNLLLSRSNVSLTGTNFTIIDHEADKIIVTIDNKETIMTKYEDSVTVVSGTNSTPEMNIITYQNKNDPTLTRSSTPPTSYSANVAMFYLGETGNIYGGIGGRSAVDEFIRGSYLRWFNQGPLYISGFQPIVNATNISIGAGSMTILLDTHAHAATLDMVGDGAFLILSNGTFVQFNSLEGITQYSDGGTISTNKYYNLVCGFAHNDVNGNRIMCIVQSTPASEYVSNIGAETDTYDSTNVFPSDQFLKNVYLPVARMVVKKVAGADEFQVLSNGQRYIDVRGSTSTAGAPASSGITIHNDLSSIQGGTTDEYYHLNSSTYTQVTSNAWDWLTEETLWNANSSSVARIGDCPSGQFVQNTTTGGVECAAPAGSGDITGVIAGTGLLGGGLSGDVTLNASADTCGAGNVSKYNGTHFNCVEDQGAAYTAGSNLTLAANEFSLDTSAVLTWLNNIYSTITYVDNLIASVGNWSADKSSYWDTSTDLDTVIATDEITELKIDFNTACAAGNHLYVSGNNLACEADADTTYSSGNGISLSTTTFSVAGNTALTQDADGLSVTNDAIGDTQLEYNTGQALTTSSSPTFDGMTVKHFKIDTINITCLNSGCNWYSNATDSCMYWPSGGKDCGA